MRVLLNIIHLANFDSLQMEYTIGERLIYFVHWTSLKNWIADSWELVAILYFSEESTSLLYNYSLQYFQHKAHISIIIQSYDLFVLLNAAVFGAKKIQKYKPIERTLILYIMFDFDILEGSEVKWKKFAIKNSKISELENNSELKFLRGVE